jgi:hypothetical protein
MVSYELARISGSLHLLTGASPRELLPAGLLFPVNIFELSPHDSGVSIDSSPILIANDTLINKHAEPIRLDYQPQTGKNIPSAGSES